MHIDSILALAKSSSEKDFLQLLFASVPDDALAAVEVAALYKSAIELLNMLQARKKAEPLVRVSKNNIVFGEIVLQIITEDMPFILDSLSNALKEEDFAIDLIVHPLVSISKDRSIVNGNENGEAISLVQIYASKICPEEEYDALEDKIKNIINCIKVAVKDWKQMRQNMSEMAVSLKQQANSSQLEFAAFLNWLVESNFIYLGYIKSSHKSGEISIIKNSALGIFCSELYSYEPILNLKSTTAPGSELLHIRKWDKKSVVHRSAHMDWLIIEEFDDQGKCVGATHFLGFFTSSVYYQSILSIPLIRKKAENIIQKYGYPESSYNYKELITALQGFPRTELLQMSESELFDIATGIVSLTLIPRVKVFLRKDIAEKFTSCLVFIPKNRFSTEVKMKIEEILCEALKGTVSKHYVQITESAVTRMQLLIQASSDQIPECDIKALEYKIKNIINLWSDELFQAMIEKFGKSQARTLFNDYKDAFDVKYSSTYGPKQTLHDIFHMQKGFAENKVQFSIYVTPHAIGGKELVQMKIYSPYKPLALSKIMPKIENMGFKAFDVVHYEVTVHHDQHTKMAYLSHFRLQHELPMDDITEELREKLETTLYKIFEDSIEDDRFNSLILYAKLSWREALILRVYARYLRQINFSHEYDYIISTLLKYPLIAQKIVQFFYALFDPATEAIEHSEIKQLAAALKEEFNNASSIAEEEVFLAYLCAILATKRTNYFQSGEDGLEKPYISLKIYSQDIPWMPDPKPYMETYVYCSYRFEASHLRGGPVARGGLRWSDRPDFRTEVLGLMKAQMTKNAIIVPSGSKGGFSLKNQELAENKELWLKEGIACYQMFLSGILDVTDNVIDGQIIPPQGVKRYDKDDPYLVVAADKGTATFSDYANEVSAKYNFWLGDAFASGGSAGYDHKKMGITAKGAWVSVEQHFMSLGQDIKNNAFTVAGIGDMAGDVFGNGMLLSKQIKLIAAFNHMHIFLDPNPDPSASFEERQRLFNLPRSQWLDYDSKLISQGGGVYERKAKNIQLSVEAAESLSVEPGKYSPDQLIKIILKSPVDLIWNGGIGTYVKSSYEKNSEIGDKNNDALRVDGKELKCKVLAEGGNLGVTPLGRIEYAKLGGKINTDFIDNSAGVDCSDHEVNIKIALNSAVMNEDMSLSQRNELLASMSDVVSQLVIKDNYAQNKILNYEEQNGVASLVSHTWLMKNLESKGMLNRALEYLPSIEDLAIRAAEDSALTRPEMAILMVYAKNSIKGCLEKYIMTQDTYLEAELLRYFPKVLQQKHQDLLLKHKLANEIILTTLSNDFVNTLGMVFFHQLTEAGYDAFDIMKAFVIVRDIFNISAFLESFGKFELDIAQNIANDIYKEIQHSMKRNIEWVLRNHASALGEIKPVVERYRNGVQDIYNSSCNIIDLSAAFSEVPKELLDQYLNLRQSQKGLDIIKIVHNTKCDVAIAMSKYADIEEKLHINWLLNQAEKYNAIQYVDKMAIQALVSEIEDLHIALTESDILSNMNRKCCANIHESKFALYENFMNELKSAGEVAWLSILILAVKQLREFV